MKILHENEYRSWVIWLTTLCVTLIGLAGAFYLFPELPPVSPLPRPFTPTVSCLIHDFHQPVTRDESSELNAVRSPALISLPGSIVFSNITWNHINWIKPPLQSSRSRNLFLEMKVPMLTDSDPGLKKPVQRSWLKSSVGLFFRSDGSNVFDHCWIKEKHKVSMILSGGLKGETLDLSSLSADAWTKKGGSWTITLYVYFDNTGKPARIFLESPSIDNELNEKVIRDLYQCCLFKPVEPCEGRIILYGSGK